MTSSAVVSAQSSSTLLRLYETSPRAQGVEICISRMHGRAVVPNPHGKEASRRSAEWALVHGLVDGEPSWLKLRAIRCGSCAAHTYPEASAEVTEIAAKLITWLFLFDDAYGEGTEALDARDLMETFASYESLLRTGRLPNDPTPFHHALAELRQDCALRATPEWLERFADSMSRYFGGCLLEFPLRRSDVVPSLPQYRRLRAWAIGIQPVLELVELANDDLLSPEEASREDIASMRELTALLCAWVNDVYSYGKEKRDGDPLNLVSVIANEYGLSEPESYERAADLFNADLRAFEALRAEFERDAPPHMKHYVQGLSNWIHGNFAWTGQSLRY
ncbi:MAG: hypothetical protein AAF799_34260 [Myxococcota bacterium]